MKKVKQLLERMEYTLLQGKEDEEITALIYDSRKAEKGAMFVWHQRHCGGWSTFVLQAAGEGRSGSGGSGGGA